MIKEFITIRDAILTLIGYTIILLSGSCPRSGGPGYATAGSSSGQFGFRSILGETDSDNFGRVLEIRAPTLAYSDKTTRADSFRVTINGAVLPGDYESTELDYVPTKEYSFRIETDFGAAEGTVSAPFISAIKFVTLPDTHYTDKPLLVEWSFPAGEENNGAIIVDASGHNSGILPPETTSYTIPAEDLENGTRSNQISITSIRYVEFPCLITPHDNSVQFFEGLDRVAGSYFGVFVSINRYVEVLRPKSR